MGVVGVTRRGVGEVGGSRCSKGDEAGSCGEGSEKQKAKPRRGLEPFLKTAAPPPEAKPAETEAKPVEPETKTAPIGNPNAGANQPASTNGKTWARDDIKAVMAQNGGRLGANKDAILKALAAEGLIKSRA